MGFEAISGKVRVRYHIGIPRVILGSVNWGIIDFPYTHMGGYKNGIWNIEGTKGFKICSMP